jgi:hypothetical protein
VADLIETSILGRLANIADDFHPVALRAVVELHRRGEIMPVTPQNLIETCCEKKRLIDSA